ncbi:hypothetical protein Z042_19480 [Chania multitudinisentens RB-25]|uniref:Uncharacterized protein n=1 Tax=Chania multitudinisentens RB-25 TaxID=1441930 RepID=W0LGS3_9GAMM|nr:hypothetical protein [Chania multitudinisentens]AHG22926.1 hypothetical protein Z042_19480 [Chania multitudinisentens RB-25]
MKRWFIKIKQCFIFINCLSETIVSGKKLTRAITVRIEGPLPFFALKVTALLTGKLTFHEVVT